MDAFVGKLFNSWTEWCASESKATPESSLTIALMSHEAFVPVALMLTAFFVALTVFFQVMRYKTKADDADTRQQLNEHLQSLRDRQQDHQAESADVLAELEMLNDMQQEELQALKLLKHRCAVRMAFERHMRAVNHNLEQEAAQLRAAFEFAAADMTGQSDADLVRPDGLAAGEYDRCSEVSDAEVTANDCTPARASQAVEATPASTVRSSQLGRSPASDFAQDERRRAVDVAAGSALIGIVAQAAADALRAVQRRDGAMAELHIAEREAELIEREFHEVIASHNEQLESAQTLLAKARDTIAKETSPELRRRAAPLSNGLDAQVNYVTEDDVLALPFDPSNDDEVREFEAECMEMEQENADLLARITEGYQEMDRLTALAVEQEAVIQSLDAEFERRDACDAFGAGGVDVPPVRAEDIDTSNVPLEEFRHRSASRVRRLRDETAWLQQFSGHVVQRLHEEMDRLSAARHEVAELVKEDEAEALLRSVIHEQIEHLNEYLDGADEENDLSSSSSSDEGDVSDAATAPPEDSYVEEILEEDVATPPRRAPAPTPTSAKYGTPAARVDIFSPLQSQLRAPPCTPAHAEADECTPMQGLRYAVVDQPSVPRAPKTTPVRADDLTPAARQGVFSPLTEQRGPRNTPKIAADLTPGARQGNVFSPGSEQRGPKNTPLAESDLTPAARQAVFSPTSAEPRGPRVSPHNEADLTLAAKDEVFSSPFSGERLRAPVNSAAGTPKSESRAVYSPLSERRAPPASPVSMARPVQRVDSIAEHLFSPTSTTGRRSSAALQQASTPLSAVKMSSARFNGASSAKKAPFNGNATTQSFHAFTSPTANIMSATKRSTFASPDNFLFSDRKIASSVSPVPRRSIVMMRDPLAGLGVDEDSLFY